MFEGYGQTECAAAATMTTPGDVSTGHVGVPIPCNQIKLVDVSDMNYFTANNEGEVGVSVVATPSSNCVWACPGLFQGAQCVLGVPQGSREDKGVFG